MPRADAAAAADRPHFALPEDAHTRLERVRNVLGLLAALADGGASQPGLTRQELADLFLLLGENCEAALNEVAWTGRPAAGQA